MDVRQLVTLGTCAALGLLSVRAAFSEDLPKPRLVSTAVTQDIINTLRRKGTFHKMLEGLELSH